VGYKRGHPRDRNPSPFPPIPTRAWSWPMAAPDPNHLARFVLPNPPPSAPPIAHALLPLRVGSSVLSPTTPWHSVPVLVRWYAGGGGTEEAGSARPLATRAGCGWRCSGGAETRSRPQEQRSPRPCAVPSPIGLVVGRRESTSRCSPHSASSSSPCSTGGKRAAAKPLPE
jgi:hypothetical protein